MTRAGRRARQPRQQRQQHFAGAARNERREAPMRLSLCSEVIREMSFAQQCDFAAKLGYDALEIAPFTLAPDPRDLGPGDVASLRRSLSDAGIACSSLHWLLVSPDGLSVTSEDPEVHERTVSVMRRLVDLAGDLGADVLVHGSPKQRTLPEGREDAAWAQAVRCFSAAADAARAAGVIYCVEPLARAETNFVNTVEDAMGLLDAIGKPALRTMVDCSATTAMGLDPAEVLESHLDSGRIAHVQVNDGNRRGPGEGDDPMGPVLATLKRHDWQGWVAVEPFVYIPDGPACAARSIGYLRGVLEGMG
jgi:D-psicose/D-tagatose/L-ribulose 3-epimerase